MKTYPKNDRKEIFGWLTYDWANSVFSTTVLGVLIGDYITTLAQSAVGENGVVISLGGYDLVTAKSVFHLHYRAFGLFQIFFLPVLGAIAGLYPSQKDIHDVLLFSWRHRMLPSVFH